MKAVCLLLILVLLFGVIASAQTGVTVSGTVEDQSGAVIPGAKLTLTEQCHRTSARKPRATAKAGLPSPMCLPANMC